MMHTALLHPGPVFIRYPRGAGTGVALKPAPALLPIGSAETLAAGRDLALWALGPMVGEALALAAQLKEVAGLSVTVVNARFAKPLDRELLLTHARAHRMVVTLEDQMLAGGFGSAVMETLQDAGLCAPVERLGWPDLFIEHGSNVDALRALHGLSLDAMRERILARWRGLAAK
jgi:1-deoxy-D-xylulose-5-phosphate synthase